MRVSMADLGLWKQGWRWVLSQKHILAWAHTAACGSRERLAFLVDRHWPAVSRACVSSSRLALAALRQWRGCMARGVLAVASLGPAAVSVGRLYSIIDDVAEFIVFLKSYPPIIREPYNKFLEKCMFGRQAEMEKIISFLLQPVPPRVDSLQVLQIIGPPRVGKSTLVEHIRYDERVHDHFSSIILCSGNSAALEDSGVVKLKTHGSHERSLVIMELADDLILDERQCKHCTLQEATCHLEVKLGADHKQIREYRETWNSGSYETEIFASRSFLVLLQGDGFWKHKS